MGGFMKLKSFFFIKVFLQAFLTIIFFSPETSFGGIFTKSIYPTDAGYITSPTTGFDNGISDFSSINATELPVGQVYPGQGYIPGGFYLDSPVCDGRVLLQFDIPSSVIPNNFPILSKTFAM